MRQLSYAKVIYLIKERIIMIMILSDGGTAVLRIQKHLDIRDEKYFVYFTAFEAAGRFGSGSVIVGDGTERSLRSVSAQNNVTAVIDAVCEPASEISAAAMRVCRENIPYVKYVNMEDDYGAKLCLSYRQLAEMITRCGGNVLMYASPQTVRAVVENLTDGGSRLYVPVLKSAGFDADAALEYSVPLRNVIEADGIDGAEFVEETINKVEAKAVICDCSVSTADKAEAARLTDIPMIVTHNMGMEYSHAAATAADAAIAVRTMKTTQA